MHATIRRFEGVDQKRTAELTGKVNETLVPQLRKLPGFMGYYLINTDDGTVFSSVGLFETPAQGEESTKVVTSWIREQELDSLLPNAPKITDGQVVVHSNGIKVA